MTAERDQELETEGAARAAALIRSASSAIVLTGAGVSVPSGVPDFRSAGTGLWERFDPFEVAHIDAFRRDPKTFWEFYRPRFGMLADKQPNDAHRHIAELERRGLIEAVATQNIDRLHVAAGSRNVLELHGSIETSSCSGCARSFPLAEVEALFDSEGIARCTGCEEPVRPDVVLFGEMLPVDVLDRAQRYAEEAELIICVGSSLEVHPAAGLVDHTLATGGKAILITQGETPYDDRAECKLDGDVEAELGAVLSCLNGASAWG